MSGAMFMPIWTDSYLADTRHLTTVQHGAYLLLLMSMWRHGGWLPNDEKRVARTAGLAMDKWRLVRAEVMELFQVQDDTITHKKLSEVLKTSLDLVAKRSTAGRAGFQAKQLKTKLSVEANVGAPHRHSQEQPVSLQSPISDLQSQSKKREDVESFAGKRAEGGQVEAAVEAFAQSPLERTYAFEDGVIKLTDKDLAMLDEAFPHVNVRAELLARSDWIAGHAEQQGKQWLQVMKGLLGKLERDRAAEAADRSAKAQAAASAATRPRGSRI